MAAVSFALASFIRVAVACGVSGGVLPADGSRLAQAPLPPRDDGVCWSPCRLTKRNLVDECTWNNMTLSFPPCGDGETLQRGFQAPLCQREVQFGTVYQNGPGPARHLLGMHDAVENDMTWLMQRARHRPEEEGATDVKKRPEGITGRGGCAPAWHRWSAEKHAQWSDSRNVALGLEQHREGRSRGQGDRRSSEVVEVEPANAEADNASARGSRDPPPPIPTLDSLEPGVRWWADLIGMTNPLEEEDGEQRIICADTFRTIVANLQGQEREERSRNIASLLSFFGLFLAEMMRAVREAENGDLQVLLQTTARTQEPRHARPGWHGPQQDDITFLMQRVMDTSDLSFHAAIRQT